MPRSVQVATPAQWLAEIEPQIVSCRHFRSGRIDRFGRVVGVLEIEVAQLPEQRQTHHLDDRGRCVLLETYSPGCRTPTRRMYRYDDFQVSESLWLDAQGQIENYHRYAYDAAAGLLTWRAEYAPDGMLFYAIVSTYDEAGKLASETWTDAKGQRVKQFTYRYDKAGEIVAETRTDGAGMPAGTLEIGYDKSGRISERSWKGPDGKRKSKLRFTYDKQGRISRIDDFGPNGQLRMKQENVHDGAGNVVSERWIDDRGKVVREVKHGQAERALARPAE